MTTDVLTDRCISEPVISFQRDTCACIGSGSPFTGGNERFKRLAVFFAEIDDVLLRSHSSRYAPEKVTQYVHG